MVLCVGVVGGLVSVLYLAVGCWIGVAAVIGGLAIWCWTANVKHERWLRSLVASREGESICGFARAFPRRSVEPLLLRAVYEVLQEQMGGTPVPVRAKDRFAADLRLDPDDLDEVYWEVADLCGYQTEGGERNPLWGKVETVADLVHFLHHQPRVMV